VIHNFKSIAQNYKKKDIEREKEKSIIIIIIIIINLNELIAFLWNFKLQTSV